MTMQIRETGLQEIERIKELWEQLNQHHLNHSSHWKGHFEQLAFAPRFNTLAQRDQVLVAIAERDDGAVGYCVASLAGSRGEIDSIYIADAERSSGIGKKLLQHGVDWLKQHGATSILVDVAQGNEAALGFYESCGFNGGQAICAVAHIGFTVE